VGAVALAATGVGAVIGATAAAATSVAGIASVATIASVASAAAAGLSLAAGLTAKKPSAADATGSQTSFSADPDAGVPLAQGRTGTAGDIVMRRGWDTRDAGDNDRQAFAAVLSLGPIAAIEGQTVDRVPVSYNSTGAAIGAFAGFMWSMTQLGALASPALAFGAGAGTPPGVGADFKLSGKAAATWTLRFDTKAKLYQNGVPAPMWTVRGALAYDPTKDSTYPGGNGPHRMADPADTAAYDAAMATWEWTENPYLLGLRWAHGYWQRDVSNPNSTYQRVMGMGSPWRLIDVAAFVEGRNIAAANGWTCGGMIYSRDEKWATMKKILQAGMGEPMPLGARISCLVNAPKVSLATVTIQDVIGQARVAATQPRRNRINTVTPRYRLEENNWQFLPGSPISIAEHIAEDGGKRSKVLDYPFIQNTKQIGTAVRYDIENSREFGPITLPLKLFWMGYKPGDCVTADLPEVGLNRQPILLLNRDLDPAGGVTTFTARSETAAKHPFALGQTATPPPTPGVTGPPLVPVPAIDAWAITATSLISAAQTVPALVVTGAVDAGTADAVVIEYRPFVTGQALGAGWTAAGVWPVGATRTEITSVRSGTAYEVAVSYQRNGVTGGRRVIGPVVTAGPAVDFDAVTGPNRPEPGATVGGTIGENIKNPMGEIIQPGEVLNSALSLSEDGMLTATIGGTTRALGKLNLIDLDPVNAVARRQLENDLASLSAAVAQLATGQAIVQNVFRDAGLFTDPDSGVAKLFAIESRADQISKLSVTLNAALASIDLKATVNYVDQAILKAQLDGSDVDLDSIFVRLTSAETSISGLQASIQLKADATVVTGLQGSVTAINQSLDALNALITTKASQTVVDTMGARLTLAEQTLNVLDVASITNAVTASRRAPAESDVAGGNDILAALTGWDAGQMALTAVAAAKTELTAKTDSNTSAIASLSLQLGVQIGAVTAMVGSVQAAQIAADQAIASDLATYRTSTNGTLAQVNQVLVAQSGINTSVAGSLTTLSSTVGNHTSTLSVYGQSIDGLMLRYGVEFNSNGAVTGFSLNNGGGRTDAVFVVDNFKIAKAGATGATVVFSIADDGAVEMPNVRVKRIAAGVVDTDQIVGNALSTTITDVQSVADVSADGAQASGVTRINSTGGVLRIDVCAQVTRTANGAQPLRLQLFRSDGTAVSGLYKSPSQADSAPVTFFAIERLGAGQRGYYVVYSVDSGSGGSRYNVTHTLAITELKR